jgi:hypothetical protein
MHEQSPLCKEVSGVVLSRKIVGSPAQYSEVFRDWMVERFAQDPEFFVKARTSAKNKKK